MRNRYPVVVGDQALKSMEKHSNWLACLRWGPDARAPFDFIFEQGLHGGYVRTAGAEAGLSQSRIDRLALQRQDAKHALVDPAQRFLPDKSFQRLDAQGKLAQRQRALG